MKLFRDCKDIASLILLGFPRKDSTEERRREILEIRVFEFDIEHFDDYTKSVMMVTGIRRYRRESSIVSADKSKNRTVKFWKNYLSIFELNFKIDWNSGFITWPTFLFLFWSEYVFCRCVLFRRTSQGHKKAKGAMYYRCIPGTGRQDNLWIFHCIFADDREYPDHVLIGIPIRLLIESSETWLPLNSNMGVAIHSSQIYNTIAASQNLDYAV